MKSKYEKSDFLGALDLAVESKRKYSIVEQLDNFDQPLDQSFDQSDEATPFEDMGYVPTAAQDVAATPQDEEPLSAELIDAVITTDGLEFSEEFLAELEAAGVFDEFEY